MRTFHYEVFLKRQSLHRPEYHPLSVEITYVSRCI